MNLWNKIKEVKHLYSLVCVLLLGINLFIVFDYYCEKNNFHVDEQWSYAHSNSFIGPYIASAEGNWNRWLPSEAYQKYLTVQPENDFDFSHIYRNLQRDMHTPLYFMALYTVNYFFPGTFSKWTGGGLNIFLWILTLLAMLKLSQKFFNNKWMALLPVVLFAFSSIGFASVLYIRVYLMQTLFAVCMLNELCSLLQEKQATKKRLFFIGLYSTLGMLTSYNSAVFSYIVSCVCGAYLLCVKEYKLLLKLALAMFLSVVAFFAVCPYAIKTLTAFGCASVGDGYSLMWHINKVSANLVDGLFSFHANVFDNALLSCGMVAAILLLTGTYAFFAGKNKEKSDETVVLITLIIAAMSGYLCYCMPEMWEYNSRYYMLLNPLWAILIFYAIVKILHGFGMAQKYAAALLVLIIGVNSVFADFERTSPYAFHQSKEDVDFINSLKHKKLIAWTGLAWSNEAASYLWKDSAGFYYISPQLFIYLEKCEDIVFKLKPIPNYSSLRQGDYLLIFNSYNKTLYYDPAKKVSKVEVCPDIYKNLSYERTLMIGNVWFDVYKINGDFLPDYGNAMAVRLRMLTKQIDNRSVEVYKFDFSGI